MSRVLFVANMDDKQFTRKEAAGALDRRRPARTAVLKFYGYVLVATTIALSVVFVLAELVA